jgi:endonuclease/exonuclease/phosphatase family metal-dependent hydrolase
MVSRRLEWTLAGGLAGWAAARLVAADRFRWVGAGAVPLLSFTPHAAAGAWAGALLLRDRGAGATAAVAGTALTATLAPRLLPRSGLAVGCPHPPRLLPRSGLAVGCPHPPRLLPRPGLAVGYPHAPRRAEPARGPVLRVLTANLRLGRAAAGPVVDLARRTDADVLFVQELTDDAAARLEKAGLTDLMPGQVTRTASGGRGGGIYARYPLAPGRAIAPTGLHHPTARLDLPSGQSVQLVCVHSLPPRPAWSPRAVSNWRRDLSVLPAPGGVPVVLAGDFNATLDHAQFRGLLRRGYADAASAAGQGLLPTWGPVPHGRPGLLAIDHVLVDSRCAVRAASVHRLPGSDHRAVYAEFRLPQ